MASELLDDTVKLLYLHEALHAIDGQALDLLVWWIGAQGHQNAHVVHRYGGGGRDAAREVPRRCDELGEDDLAELEQLCRLEEEIA